MTRESRRNYYGIVKAIAKGFTQGLLAHTRGLQGITKGLQKGTKGLLLDYLRITRVWSRDHQETKGLL